MKKHFMMATTSGPGFTPGPAAGSVMTEVVSVPLDLSPDLMLDASVVYPECGPISAPNRGFHVGDARLGGVRIVDARVKIQHDAQWSVLTRASFF